MTKTGTGPTFTPGESSVQNFHIPPELVPPARERVAVVVLLLVVFLCLTVLPDPALGPEPPEFGERPPAPTVVALAGADGILICFKQFCSTINLTNTVAGLYLNG